MSGKSLQAIILAAGQGSRFTTGITKMVALFSGQPLVTYPVQVMQQLGLETTVVVGHQKELVLSALHKHCTQPFTTCEQREQLGTGHAMAASQPHWFADNVLVLNGDMPLLTPSLITQLHQEHCNTQSTISFIVCHNTDPHASYGRLVKQEHTIKIVEKKHFTGVITDFPLVNAGVYIFKRSFLEEYIGLLSQNQLTQEFYLTDLIEIASKQKLTVTPVTLPPDQLQGVNTLQELAAAEQLYQTILRPQSRT